MVSTSFRLRMSLLDIGFFGCFEFCLHCFYICSTLVSKANWRKLLTVVTMTADSSVNSLQRTMSSLNIRKWISILVILISSHLAIVYRDGSALALG